MLSLDQCGMRDRHNSARSIHDYCMRDPNDSKCGLRRFEEAIQCNPTFDRLPLEKSLQIVLVVILNAKEDDWPGTELIHKCIPMWDGFNTRCTSCIPKFQNDDLPFKFVPSDCIDYRPSHNPSQLERRRDITKSRTIFSRSCESCARQDPSCKDPENDH